MSSMKRPTSIGLSLSLEAIAPSISIDGSAGRYKQYWNDSGVLTDKDLGRDLERWKRRQLSLPLEFPGSEGLHPHARPQTLRRRLRVFRHSRSRHPTPLPSY